MAKEPSLTQNNIDRHRNELLESQEGGWKSITMTIFEWKGFVKTFARIRIGASLSCFGQKKRNL
jgi:hypothetical protein